MDWNHGLAAFGAPNDDVRAALAELNALCALYDPHDVSTGHASSVLDNHSSSPPEQSARSGEKQLAAAPITGTGRRPAGTDVVQAMDGSVSKADDAEVVDLAGETAEGEARVDVAPVFVDLVSPLEQAEIAANDAATAMVRIHRIEIPSPSRMPASS